MNKLLFPVLFLLSIAANAQISITATDMPVANDTLRYSNANTLGYNYLAINADTGASKLWNYSNLIATSQTLQSFKTSASTPYALYFAGMVGYKVTDSISLGIATLKNVWDFFRTTSTRYTKEGTGFAYNGFPLASDYDKPDVIYNFPLNFRDKDSNYFHVSTQLAGLGGLIQSGTRVSVVDGWGSITTPIGTYQCVRVKSVIKEVDSIDFGAVKIPIYRNSVEYRWLAKGIHIPILEIDVTLTGTAGTVNAVKYRDMYRYIPVKPTPAFVANPLYVKPNTDLALVDQSLNIPTRWKWTITPNTYTFNTGSLDTLQNPVLKFSAAGNYTVKLWVSNIAGKDSLTKTGYVKVGDVPVCKFGADHVTTNLTSIVNLADSSTNAPSKWKWSIFPTTFTYNSGTNDSSKAVKVLFTAGGYYLVDLKVTNLWGSDQLTKANYIFVAHPAGITKNAKTTLNVFPNPVKDELNFVLDGVKENIQVRVFNLDGREVLSGSFDHTDAIHLDTHTLSQGVYLLSCSIGNEVQYSRFVK